MEVTMEKTMEKGKGTLILTAAGLAACAVFFIYGMKNGLFASEEAMAQFLSGFGIWGPLAFVGLQVVQVVIPIMPGGISCLAGVLLFGPVWGFVYNYVGISIGSVLAFLLSKNYGKPFVKGMIGEKNYEKYIGWLDKGTGFDKAFAIAIFLPVAPDDLLCYIAGLTKMTLKKFTAIILLGKPGSILLYSLGLTGIMEAIKYFF